MVVLPFVPVTPATSSSLVGSPKNASAATAMARARVLDDELRNRDVNCSLHDKRDCTFRHRLDREVVPVRARPRYAEEQTPSVTRLAS